MKVNSISNRWISTIIGKKLQEKREELGLTQKEVAKETGLSAWSISRRERGLASISTIELAALCETYDMSIVSFLAALDFVDEDEGDSSEFSELRKAIARSADAAEEVTR